MKPPIAQASVALQSDLAPSSGTVPSRYRSVRRTAQQNETSPPPPPPAFPASTPQNEAIARSMSRYRRNRTGTGQLANQVSSPPPIPQTPARNAAAEDPFKTPPSTGRSNERTPTNSSRQTLKRIDDKVRESGLKSLTSEERRVQRIRQYEQREAQREKQVEEVFQTEAAATCEPVEYKSRPKDDRVSPRQPSRRTTGDSEPAETGQTADAGKEKSSFFSRMRNKRTPPTSPRPDIPKTTTSPSKSKPKTQGIEPGGGGIVPGTDAPVSAVNAGERRVVVKFGEKTINLPVTPDTTPVDLIRSAATILNETIIPDKSVLLESCSKIGLERPLRKYEHVRDILNSWDRDSSNALLLVPADGDSNKEELDAAHVPTDEPEDVSAMISYSQVPGKWKKQWITLRSDGQMLMSKNQAAKETSNICHMSDFDVYTPTKYQLKKVIRPGKKHCFAVKSQQKSTMFMTKTTYVHFFATDDRKLAGNWYRAIQSWRSWYLVHRMGAGQPSQLPTPIEHAHANHGPPVSSTGHSKAKPSVDSFYQIGSFKPLLTTEEVSQTIAAPPKMESAIPHVSPEPVEPVTYNHHTLSSRPRRRHSPPPSSFPPSANRKSSQQRPANGTAAPPPSKPASAQIFAQNSLLGRTYTQRQAEARSREAGRTPNDGPFVQGSTLLSGGGGRDNQQSSFSYNPSSKHDASAHNSSSANGLRKQMSIRQKPQPLLNFDEPEVWQPPQHRGKGRGVKTDGNTALVDAATTPEVAIPIPPRETWRRSGPTQQNGASQPSRYRSNAARRQKEAKVDPFADPAPLVAGGRTRTSSAEQDEEVFTGLLAKTGQSWGDGGKGRGIMTGHREADRPMLDVREGSRFAPGSLLAQREGQEEKGPVIDRDKHPDEEVVNVGEAVR